MMRVWTAACALMAAALTASAGAQRAAAPLPPPPRSGPMPPLVALDAATIARGRAIYAAQCSSCHGDDGAGDGPSASALPSKPADQTNFRVMDVMNDLTLARRIQAGGLGMPSFQQLRGDDLVALVGYIRRLSRPDTYGVELHGLAQEEVRSFQPVSPAALATPPPEDWLSFRGTPDAAAYSPLTEITRENVGRLQLAWSRAMEPGGQYSTPLVRGGTMFLAHPGDVIQALDATSGDLIWEFRWDDRLATPDSAARRAARPRARSIRNIAILGDRLLDFTADRHLIALDARTGALAWSIEEAARDRSHGGADDR